MSKIWTFGFRRFSKWFGCWMVRISNDLWNPNQIVQISDVWFVRLYCSVCSVLKARSFYIYIFFLYLKRSSWVLKSQTKWSNEPNEMNQTQICSVFQTERSVFRRLLYRWHLFCGDYFLFYRPRLWFIFCLTSLISFP